jgi:hypothetical protein
MDEPNRNLPRNKQASYRPLFNQTYWSGHTPTGEENEKKLCMNRDLMAEEYNLKKFHYYHTKFPKKYWKELIIADLTDVERRMSIVGTFGERIVYRKKSCVNRLMRIWVQTYDNIIKHKDHPEYYTDTDKNIVSVFSKYIADDDTETLELIEKSGYKKINPIYNLDQKTFIKVIYTY